MRLVDLNAPIEPARSAAGIHLGTHVSELDDLLGPLQAQFPHPFSLATVYEARYSFERGAVVLAFDVRNGRLFRITVGTGYKGSLFDRIRIGMTFRAAKQQDKRLEFSSAEAGVEVRGCEGVFLEFPDDEVLDAEQENPPISFISVFVPQILTLQGQDGNWSSE